MNSLQLLRIEHKLDLVLRALKYKGIAIDELPQLDELDGDICPVCEDTIHFSIDVMAEAYVRSCSCEPPIPLVPGIAGVMTPPETTAIKDKTSDSPEQADPPREG